MTFAELKTACELLRQQLSETTGLDLVNVVSVDEPEELLNELHFVKLVLWSYAFLFEASQPATDHILSLMRAANPEEYGVASRIKQSVNQHRTVKTHNLSPENKNDDYKRRQVDIWLATIGGDPIDWQACCLKLCEDVMLVVQNISKMWTTLTASEEDTENVVRDLIASVERYWPAHCFDRMLESATAEIGLEGLDCVAYRSSRLDNWRKIVDFFDTRDHARTGVYAAICRELEHTFGHGDPTE